MIQYIDIGGKKFYIGGHTYIMGILNMTPDSFSDGGSYKSKDEALRRVEKMISEGADIIDAGGESTRPGYQKISDEAEIERVVPVIEAIKARFDIPVSVDTYKSGVAETALLAGADLVNDIWGFKYDRHMAEIVKAYDAACCLMHNQEGTVYSNFLEDVAHSLKESVQLAENAGISRHKIIIDPGVGFGKTYEQNLLVLKYLESFKSIGLPVLLGASRKSAIGLTLQVPAGERLPGTIAATVLAVMKGVSFVRVHDVLANKQAVMMAEAVINAGGPKRI